MSWPEIDLKYHPISFLIIENVKVSKYRCRNSAESTLQWEGGSFERARCEQKIVNILGFFRKCRNIRLAPPSMRRLTPLKNRQSTPVIYWSHFSILNVCVCVCVCYLQCCPLRCTFGSVAGNRSFCCTMILTTCFFPRYKIVCPQ